MVQLPLAPSPARPLTRSQVGEDNWNDWRWQLRHMLRGADDLGQFVELSDEERAGLQASRDLFRVGATPYYASLMDPVRPSCPVRRQVIPRAEERDFAPEELRDPLGEETNTPVPRIFHKYPDRVLLMVVDRCAIYCRHCNRRRIVGGDDAPTRDELDAAIDYIARTPAVRDVLLSGGDPLLLSTRRLGEILARLRAIPHVDIIRIGTRVPVVLPMRIDEELVGTLRSFHPLFVNTHFNHPVEVTGAARRACERLVDAGIPVGNQSVLLRGINSSVACLRELFRQLLTMRVRPYYLFQGDTVIGTDHLRTRVETAIELYDQLRGWITGMAIPHLVIDTPGGGGKVPIGPEYLLDVNAERALVRNYRGERINYPQPRGPADATVPYDRHYFSGDRSHRANVL